MPEASWPRVRAKAIKSLAFFAPRPLHLRLDVLPFAAIYIALIAAAAYSWFSSHETYLKASAVGTVLALVSHILLLLFEKWHVSVLCAVAYRKAKDLKDAEFVMVVPNENHGATELCQLSHPEEGAQAAPLDHSATFEFRKMRFAYFAEGGEFRRLKYPTKLPLSDWAKRTGYGSTLKLAEALELWGPNAFEVPMPSFYELLQEQMLAPFFVFQVFCVALWCMDEYWYYSIFTLFMLIAFESTVVQSRIRNLSELRSLQTPKQYIQVYRSGKWEQVPGDCLLPGDVISIGRPAAGPSSGGASSDAEGAIVPADCLLLHGTCICEEAVLTGESTPQWKTAICGGSGGAQGAAASAEGPAQREPGRLLSVKRDKQHIVFGGTKILQHTAPKGSMKIKMPDGGCLAVVLRTGFDTSQGQLMRTILYSTERITANSYETGLFICFLLVPALMASAYVMYHGLQDPDRSRYKLFLNCTMIITSVIPPELPMELTIAVNQSIVALHKMAVFCTEPFRIPFAGKVDTCAFDKTGTLTSDDLVFQGLVLAADVKSHEAGDGKAPVLTEQMINAPKEAIRVMAACQSLLTVGGQLVGDPLEKAAFAATGWAHGGDSVASGKGVPPSQREKVQTLTRFHFSSALKRMSALVRVEADSSSSASLWVVTKGAPEALLPLLAEGQGGREYIAAYKHYAAQGARVIALAARSLGPDSAGSDLRSIARDKAELQLQFVGFAVFMCPVKPQSEPALAMLKHSNHRLVMITGDAALTACHVSARVHIVDRPVLILSRKDNMAALGPHTGRGSLDETPREQKGGSHGSHKALPDSDFEWVSPDEATHEPFSRQAGDIAALAVTHDLCVPGDGLLHAELAGCLGTLVPLAQVFARTSPDQKELIINTLKKAGHTTLMCGDGTNDVGSLKAAHIGVALLSASIIPPRRGSRARAARGGRAPPPAEDDLRPQRKRGMRSKIRPGLLPEEDEAAGAGSKLVNELKSQGMQVSDRAAKMSAWMDSLEASAAEGTGMVKPGDASMAAPFTAREPSVAPVCNIVRQGRSTLVTTLQMFKILGLMCLSSAFSLSILYLEGIKLGDTQATVAGLLSAALFFLLSASEPRHRLSSARPHSRIFGPYVLLSLLGQFAVHLSFLVLMYKTSLAATPEDQRLKPDADFTPNIVNSATFLASFAMQTTTFAVNYVGHPFNTAITDHKKFLYALAASAGFFLVAATEIFLPINETMELVPLPPWLRGLLMAGALADFLVTLGIEQVARHVFPAPLPRSKASEARALLGRKAKDL